MIFARTMPGHPSWRSVYMVIYMFFKIMLGLPRVSVALPTESSNERGESLADHSGGDTGFMMFFQPFARSKTKLPVAWPHAQRSVPGDV